MKISQVDTMPSRATPVGTRDSGWGKRGVSLADPEPLFDDLPTESAAIAAPSLGAAHASPSAPWAAANAIDRQYQLLLRFAAFNIAAFALLAAAYVQGWIDIILRADSTMLSAGIFFVFLGGLAVCAKHVWAVSVETNHLESLRPPPDSVTERYLVEIAGRDAGSRAILAAGLRTQLASRISLVRYVANSLVLLGLIGTVLGFVIALSAVDPEVAGDVRRITPMVATLIQGMSVALYTTLVGAVLHLWLSVNYHILSVGAARFAAHLIARGERGERG